MKSAKDAVFERFGKLGIEETENMVEYTQEVQRDALKHAAKVCRDHRILHGERGLITSIENEGWDRAAKAIEAEAEKLKGSE